MNTGDPIDALIGLAAVMALFSPVVLLIGLVEWILDRSSAAPPRRSNRISAREMELVGDDWRDCVADFFAATRSERKGVNHDGA